MRYIGNALSLGMLDELPATMEVSSLSLDEARAYVRAHSPQSCIGHADTAELVSAMLETPVEMRRVSTSLRLGDEILVAQYNGPRLPEGATSLPEGAKLRWMLVRVV